MTEGYRAPRCECGHPVGSHASGGTHWPHPSSFGLCFVSDCDCREFVEATPAVASSEKEH